MTKQATQEFILYDYRIPGGKGRRLGKAPHGGRDPNGPEFSVSYIKYRQGYQSHPPYPYPNAVHAHKIAYIEWIRREEREEEERRQAAIIFHNTGERTLQPPPLPAHPLLPWSSTSLPRGLQLPSFRSPWQVAVAGRSNAFLTRNALL